MTPNASTSGVFGRWLRFNLIGVIGVGVQLTVLMALVRIFNTNYLVATTIAVESAIIHNFLWHERFTWRSRSLEQSLYRRLLRFFRFNMANGTVSIVGNLVLMYLLTGKLGIPYLLANLISIASCALINFFVSDRLVFVTAKEPEGG